VKTKTKRRRKIMNNDKSIKERYLNAIWQAEELLGGINAHVKNHMDEVPDDVVEEDVEKAQLVFEKLNDICVLFELGD
jgi:hypothetical protein